MNNTSNKSWKDTHDFQNLSRVPTGEKVTGEHGLHWERPVFQGGLKYPGGYTGHITKDADQPHVLDVPMKRAACLGYSAFRPGKKEIIGKPIVSLAEERGDGEAKHVTDALASRGLKNMLDVDNDNDSISKHSVRSQESVESIRGMWKNVDIEERYIRATKNVLARGQSLEMLVQIVQAKLASRVNSYAEQKLKVRLIFQSFDENGDGVLDEEEFRQCLERLNIQLDDDQVLALFAFFDEDRIGVIEWEKFQNVTMVQNPKGGTAVLPKQILMTTKYLDMI
jgi:hypothetical protein